MIKPILAVLVSLVGVFAVFFPDTFNLQKNNISSFEVEINTKKDVDSLWDFLNSHTEQIVHLDISICGDREEKHMLPRVSTDDSSLTIYHDDDCDPDNHHNCTGDHFYFNSPDSKINVWNWYKHEECANGNDGIRRVSGYFLVPDGAGFGMGHLEWMLTHIPKKDVLLKQY